MQLGNNCKSKISKHNCFNALPSNKITVLIHGRCKHIYLNLLLDACHLKTSTFWVSAHFRSLFMFHGITNLWNMTDPLHSGMKFTDTEIPACFGSCCSGFWQFVSSWSYSFPCCCSCSGRYLGNALCSRWAWSGQGKSTRRVCHYSVPNVKKLIRIVLETFLKSSVKAF